MIFIYVRELYMENLQLSSMSKLNNDMHPKNVTKEMNVNEQKNNVNKVRLMNAKNVQEIFNEYIMKVNSNLSTQERINNL